MNGIRQAAGARELELPVSAEDRLVARYAALAIAIHLIEATLPSPLPGIKPGLANVVVQLVLARHGWRAAAWVAVLRVLVSSLLLGTFLSPTFLLSAAGAASALLVLAPAHACGRFGPVGLSLLAAQAHMAAQFTLAYTLLIPHAALLALLPVLMTAAVVTGLAGGIISEAVQRTATGPGR
ncbi:Gx transporter family protein [Plasticicumulans acidivorans]|uniref:Gx transporter family protein n=1 Tax=Plasticicumulans acidivorans TaxID=886464 RepID=UPI00319E5F78